MRLSLATPTFGIVLVVDMFDAESVGGCFVVSVRLSLPNIGCKRMNLPSSMLRWDKHECGLSVFTVILIRTIYSEEGSALSSLERKFINALYGDVLTFYTVLFEKGNALISLGEIY